MCDHLASLEDCLTTVSVSNQRLDLMKLMRRLVEASWEETGVSSCISGSMALASCLPSSTL